MYDKKKLLAWSGDRKHVSCFVEIKEVKQLPPEEAYENPLFTSAYCSLPQNYKKTHKKDLT